MKINYRLIVFQDINNKKYFFCKSTLNTKHKIKINNKSYDLYKMEISRFSHPFYIGHRTHNKITGRIDKFNKKYNY
ncbi:50S ribosomal protein L31 [Candidatus Shikimatogenerans bostrichidophilus]|uniref:50S ribosomal protein L31 n=1 Tax=Candidatus Shikimatogenerans bostrichidophilus TaxID=2943807 RepID=UPI0029676152